MASHPSKDTLNLLYRIYLNDGLAVNNKWQLQTSHPLLKKIIKKGYVKMGRVKMTQNKSQSYLYLTSIGEAIVARYYSEELVRQGRNPV